MMNPRRKNFKMTKLPTIASRSSFVVISWKPSKAAAAVPAQDITKPPNRTYLGGRSWAAAAVPGRLCGKHRKSQHKNNIHLSALDVWDVLAIIHSFYRDSTPTFVPFARSIPILCSIQMLSDIAYIYSTINESDIASNMRAVLVFSVIKRACLTRR
jgi:hypothetical protein